MNKCLNCGKVFKPKYQSVLRPAKYCSNPCRLEGTKPMFDSGIIKDKRREEHRTKYTPIKRGNHKEA